jgi:carbon-monoxide dehydrogenase small subunit
LTIPLRNCRRGPTAISAARHHPEEFMGIAISMTVNGKAVSVELDPRTLLVELLRERLRLTGTHVGCDTGQCGACTVHIDGRAAKSCNVLAAQLEGATIVTIEGIADNGGLHPMQAAFRQHHGLQCGFCTPGMVMNALELVTKHPTPSEETIRKGLEGNLCRCTGYHNIVKAVQAGAANMKR